MWKSRSPGVATAVCTEPLISVNGLSSLGSGLSVSRPQASCEMPTLQVKM